MLEALHIVGGRDVAHSCESPDGLFTLMLRFDGTCGDASAQDTAHYSRPGVQSNVQKEWLLTAQKLRVIIGLSQHARKDMERVLETQAHIWLRGVSWGRSSVGQLRRQRSGKPWDVWSQFPFSRAPASRCRRPSAFCGIWTLPGQGVAQRTQAETVLRAKNIRPLETLPHGGSAMF